VRPLRYLRGGAIVVALALSPVAAGTEVAQAASSARPQRLVPAAPAAPQARNVAPQARNVAPQARNVAPQARNVAPQARNAPLVEPVALGTALPALWTIGMYCPGWLRTVWGSAADYLDGRYCPDQSFEWSGQPGYAPIWLNHAGRWHVGDPGGQCTGVAERSWYFDFHAACMAHDYCYDLGREHYFMLFKGDCDLKFHEIMLEDCAGRTWPTDSWCRAKAAVYLQGVKSLGPWTFWPEHDDW